MCRFLRDSERCVYIGEVGGEFQFAFSILVRDIAALHRTVEEFTDRFGTAIRSSAVSIITASRHFGVRYLSDIGAKPRMYEFSISDEVVPVDEFDLRLLDLVRLSPDASLSELAREASAPRSTVEYRVERLKEANIIAGSGYRLNSIALGLHTSYVLLNVRGPKRQATKLVADFAAANQHVLALQVALGNWDLALVIQGEEPHCAIRVVQLLDQKVGDSIQDVRILPSFRVFQLWGRPLATARESRDA